MKTDYAVRALVDLAQRYGQGTVQSGDIATRQSIPEPYLDQILTVLRKGGVIRSVRGPQGGHILAKAPDGVTLAEVVGLLEGSLAPIGGPDRSEDNTSCSAGVIHEVWQEWQAASLHLLAAISIGELAERQHRRDLALMYHI